MLDFFDAIIRRTLSLVISVAGMLLLFPVYLAIAILIKRDSPGPVIQKEERVGRRGRPFMLRKFRTVSADRQAAGGSSGSGSLDRGVTAFGSFLRETKLAELPQLWNVFVGDLNLVGPRAEDPKTVADWPDEICREILSVRPGLTGPAAVIYAYFDNLLQSQNVTERSLFDILPTRLRLDQLYVRRRNLLTDLDVMCWTALDLLPRLRSARFPENLLPPGILRFFFSPHVFGFLSDLMASFLAAVIAGSLFPSGAPLINQMQGSLGFCLIIALIYSLANLITGSYKVRWELASAGDSLDLAISTGLVTLLLAIGNLLLPGGPAISPAFLALTGSLAFIGFVTLRYRERLMIGLASAWTRLRGHSLDKFGEPVLIIGGGDTGRYTISLLRDGPLARAFKVVGILDDDPAKLGAVIDEVKVIGATNDIPALSAAFDVGLIFFAINEIDPGESRRIARLCRSSGVRMIRVPDVMNQLRSYFPKDEGEQVALIGAVLQDSTHDRLTGAYNRLYFLRHLERELRRGAERSLPCSLIGFEVGYDWPDGIVRSRALAAQVLQVVAERTLRFIRKVDIFGRVGENEFALLLPETDLQTASRLAERLKKQLISAPVWTDRGPLDIALTIAAVSQAGGEEDAERFLEEARKKIQAEKPVGLPVEETRPTPIPGTARGEWRQT